jgi:hypothetical protein
MMRMLFGSLVVLVATTSPVATAEPYRFGSLGPHLADDDWTAIKELASAEGGVPWALYGWYSMVLPEVRHVDAFLPPSNSTARLKRGRVLHLKCTPASREQESCGQWMLDKTNGEYVQVADGPALEEVPAVRRATERPILVSGSFSDTELLTLVEYIRSSPAPAGSDEMLKFSISGDLPILDIERRPDDSVWVRLSLTGNPGETATVLQRGDRWEVVELVHWIA